MSMDTRALLERFPAFFGELPVAAVLLDPRMRVRAVNRSYLELTGFGEADVVGQSCPSLQRCELYRDAYQPCRCRGDSGEPAVPSLNLCDFACPFKHDESTLDRPIPVWLTTATGSSQPVYRSYGRVRDEQGRCVGILMLIHPMGRLHQVVEADRAELDRLEVEMRLAALVNRELEPQRLDRVEGLEYGLCSLPYRPVGGDLAEVMSQPGGRAVLYVCDVSGKSLPAALLLPLLRSVFHQHVLEESPAQAVGRWNRQLTRLLPPGFFCAGTFLFWEQGSLSLVYAGLGPAWVQPGGAIAGSGLVLGVNPRARYSQVSLRLEPGQLLSLWSDGIGEVVEEPGAMLRMLAASPDLPLAVERLVRGLKRGDDATLLAVRRL